MTTQNSSYYQIEKIGAISGILSIVFYFSVAVFSFIPGSIVLLIAFSFPLLWIISFMGLYHFLKKQNHTPTLEIAYIFGIIGAAIACVFIVVQQANFIWHEEAMEVVKSEEVKALYKASYRGANRVQAAMDVAFDIFITISWVLFGVNIAKSKSFNKILGYGGSVISISLLALNMYTFPTSPAESVVFDLVLFLGICILIFYVWFLMVLIKKKKHS